MLHHTTFWFLSFWLSCFYKSIFILIDSILFSHLHYLFLNARTFWKSNIWKFCNLILLILISADLIYSAMLLTVSFCVLWFYTMNSFFLGYLSLKFFEFQTEMCLLQRIPKFYSSCPGHFRNKTEVQDFSSLADALRTKSGFNSYLPSQGFLLSF